MATVQGLCRNCGSLMMIDDRDETCECVFCNCVFPTSEAIEIFNDPEGREFPNEKFEPSAEGKRHHTTRVFSDDNIEKAIKREELAKAQRGDDVAVKKNEFEVSPNDVKAPAKAVLIISSVFVALVIITIVIALPMYNTRKDITAKISSNIESVFDGVAEVDTRVGDDGYAAGYSICGQTCQTVKVITDEDIGEDGARTMFENYCSVRSEARGKSGNAGVNLTIYSGDVIYSVTEKNGSINVKCE